MAAKALTWELAPSIHVRWRAGVTVRQREASERRFMLSGAEQTNSTTWAYDLLDLSKSNIEALVRDDGVEDTNEIDRAQFEVSGLAPVGLRETWLLYRLPFPRYPLVLEHTPTLLLLGAGVLYLSNASRQRRGEPTDAGSHYM